MMKPVCCIWGNIIDPTLPSTVQDNDPVISLGGMDTNGNGADMVTFTVDGIPQTTFDPAAYMEGDHTIVMTFDGADDGNGGIAPMGGSASPGCVQEVQQVVEVIACDAPVANCQNVTVQLNDMGVGVLTAAEVDNMSTEGCGLQSIVIDETDFDCMDVGTNITVTLTITDDRNASDNCMATVTVEDENVPFDFGGIADLNVTLGPDCSTTITPKMVITGFNDCIDSYNIMIDGVATDQAIGCGEHTYMIELIEDGEIVYTCWGSIFAEDKTNPVVDCPDNTDNVGVEFDLQTLDGSIDGTEPSINLADYSCFQSFFEPADGVAYNYDLITFTVDPDLPETDVYNIQTISNIPGLNMVWLPRSISVCVTLRKVRSP